MSMSDSPGNSKVDDARPDQQRAESQEGGHQEQWDRPLEESVELRRQLNVLARQLSERDAALESLKQEAIRSATEKQTLQTELAATRGCLDGIRTVVESAMGKIVAGAVDTQVRLADLTRRYGSFGLEEKFSSESFVQAAAKAEKRSRISILNTFLPNITDIADSLTDALDRGVEIRILVLRRTCREVKYRAETLGLRRDQVVQQIEQTLDHIESEIYARARAENRSRLMVRVFECWPPFAMYGTDEQIMVGYYLHRELAVNGPQLMLSPGHKSFGKFKEQFNNIWHLDHAKDLAMPDWRAAESRLDYKRSRD
jgi:hypothetical protein